MVNLPLFPMTLTAVNSAAMSVVRHHPDIDDYEPDQWTAVLLAAVADVGRSTVAFRRDADERADLVRSLIRLAGNAALWAEVLEGGRVAGEAPASPA